MSALLIWTAVACAILAILAAGVAMGCAADGATFLATLASGAFIVCMAAFGVAASLAVMP